MGVISDSLDELASPNDLAHSIANGELPANSTTLNDDAGGEDEGRAMAEIIYDEAPGISGILFSTGTAGAAAKVNSINKLVAQGVKVIADDTFQATEPYFQDGVISQAVDKAKAAGVAYFVSAGNRARPELGGDVFERLGHRGLRSFGRGRHGADRRHDPRHVRRVRRAAVGRAVGPRNGRLRGRRLRDQRGRPTFRSRSDTNNIATGLPSEFVSIANNASHA